MFVHCSKYFLALIILALSSNISAAASIQIWIAGTTEVEGWYAKYDGFDPLNPADTQEIYGIFAPEPEQVEITPEQDGLPAGVRFDMEIPDSKMRLVIFNQSYESMSVLRAELIFPDGRTLPTPDEELVPPGSVPGDTKMVFSSFDLGAEQFLVVLDD